MLISVSHGDTTDRPTNARSRAADAVSECAMITPEDIAEEWFSRSNEERDELLNSRRQRQLGMDAQAVPQTEPAADEPRADTTSQVKELPPGKAC